MLCSKPVDTWIFCKGEDGHLMKMKNRLMLRLGRLKEREKQKPHSRIGRAEQKLRQCLFSLRKDRLEREIFHSCVLLKNLAIVHRELPMSTDFILEQLMETGQPLRRIFADILTAYRHGEKQSAFDRLPQQIPTKTAQDFARILGKMDDISPSDLIIQMDVFLQMFSAERKTKAMARAERKSVVTTIASTITIFIVLLNFIVVVIFLDTLQILNQLF